MRSHGSTHRCSTAARAAIRRLHFARQPRVYGWNFDSAWFTARHPDANDQYVNFENFLKQGPSTFTLVGDNSEIFELPILGGELLVNGTLVNAAVPIFSGGLLGGTGTIGSFDAGPGAIVAPGASIGTLHVLGDGHFADGSFFQVEVNANGPRRPGGVACQHRRRHLDVRATGSYPLADLTVTRPGGDRHVRRVVDDLPDIEVLIL